MKLNPIALLFASFCSHASAQSGYVCAAQESPLMNREIHKFVLIENPDSGRFELKETVSMKRDTLCTENSFSQGKKEIICLGSRFYFSLYVEDKDFMVSYWRTKVLKKEDNSSVIFKHSFSNQELKDNDENKLEPVSRTGSCDVF